MTEKLINAMNVLKKCSVGKVRREHVIDSSKVDSLTFSIAITHITSALNSGSIKIEDLYNHIGVNFYE